MLRFPPRNIAHATFMLRSATTASRNAENHAHRHNHSLQNKGEEPIASGTTPAAPAAQTRYLSASAAATLHGKTQGFVLRFPPRNKAHATFMQPLQCDLQPQLQETQRTTHTDTQPLIAEHRGGSDRVRNDPSRPRRTDEVYLSSSAAATLHGKTQGFVLRFPPQNKAHATFMQPLQCDLQPQLQEPQILSTKTPPLIPEHRGGNDRVRNDPSRTRRTDEVPFIVGCSHFTRKNTRFRAAVSSPSSPLPFVTTSLPHFPSWPLPFITTSLRHHFPSSSLRFLITSLPHHFPSSPPSLIASYSCVMYCYVIFVTTSLHHHFPSSPLPFLITSLPHHFPSSPLPFVTTSLPHHFPSSTLPFLTTSLPHHFPSSPLPFLTTSLPHHFPSSPLPFVTTSLPHHFLPFLITSLPHHFPSSPLPFVTTLSHSSLFFCYVLLCYVLLCDAPPFIKVNSIASYSFVMYFLCYVLWCDVPPFIKVNSIASYSLVMYFFC